MQVILVISSALILLISVQVHKETIDKVPNSQPSRGNIEIEIYGMEGIPDADLKAHETARNQEDDDEPGAKHARQDSPAVGTPPLQVSCVLVWKKEVWG